MVLSKDIKTNHWFMGSVFGNSECETILRNIVVMQKQLSPEKWIPFSWNDYKSFCSHDVTEDERDILMAFANGGRAHQNVYVDAGWLQFDGAYFSFTEKMIQYLAEKWPEPKGE